MNPCREHPTPAACEAAGCSMVCTSMPVRPTSDTILAIPMSKDAYKEFSDHAKAVGESPDELATRLIRTFMSVVAKTEQWDKEAK